MKKLFLFFAVSLAVICANGQTENVMYSKTTKKLTHQQKIDNREAKKDSIAKMIDWMVNNRQFNIKPTIIKTNIGKILTNTNNGSTFFTLSSNNLIISIEPNPYIIITPQMGLYQEIDQDPWIGALIIIGTISKFEVKKQGKSGRGYLISLLATTQQANTFDIVINLTRSGKVNAIINRLNLIIAQTPRLANDSRNLMDYAFPIYYEGSLTPLEPSFISTENSFY